MTLLKVLLSRGALRSLRRARPDEAQRIRGALDRLAADPRGPGLDVKNLHGRSGHRLRVGDWRVIFELTGDGIVVKAVRRRGDAYIR